MTRRLVVGLVVVTAFAGGAVAPRGAAAARPVFMVGDSVMASAAPTLAADAAAHGWAAAISARVGRTTQEGVGIVAAARGSLPADVIVELGNNDGRNPAIYRARIDAVMQQLRGVRRVVWLTMTPFASWVPGANAELLAAVQRWPNLHVADWGAASLSVPGGLIGPGPHLTAAGQHAFADFVVGQLDASSGVTTFTFGARHATRRVALPFTPVAFAATHGVAVWVAGSNGEVASLSGSRARGSLGPGQATHAVVDITATRSGRGYWLVASDGGVFSFGDAQFHGSTGAIRLAQPIVGMAATPSGRGYWLVASDGGVFSFGDARFRGSLGAVPLAAPIVGIAATRSGRGYWLVGADGGVFTFGDARFTGSASGRGEHALGIAATRSGYLVVTTT
jgi:hypothetical protein